MALWGEWDVISADERKGKSAALGKFAAEFDIQVPVKIPVNGPVPTFGPLSDLGESRLETYNRAWEIMRYLSSLMRKARDEGRRLCFISGSSKGSDALIRTLQSAKSHNISIPTEDQLLDRDLPGFKSGESFRDYLRHLLKCGEIRMCVTSFELTYIVRSTDVKRALDIRRARWSEIQRVLGEHGSHFDFVIMLEVEAIDDQDDEAPLFEAEYTFPTVRETVPEQLKHRGKDASD
ncbi:Helicase C-terminal [Penicillium mononematosum]|uniref:Helicase C-terminal n=1 Tax=Penicillium mononematosum TaxID=268346 RepID=UPI0025479430|nr:Helicase C-terminal [Penicillium mononematosum]KAJ6185176.1 Helicase C-terminal [Penicillium mononematosum]